MFDFEKLDVYQLSLTFCQDIQGVLEALPRSEYPFIDQLKRASLSIPLNIAEGCGRWHDKEKKQFFFIARGSTFECIPLLTLIETKGLIQKEKHAALREKMKRLVQMLTKMANNLTRDRES